MNLSTQPMRYLASSTVHVLEHFQAASLRLMLPISSVLMAEPVRTLHFNFPPLMITFWCFMFSGQLCGDCEHDYGITFDLRYCRQNCGATGIVLLIAICVVTLLVSLAVLYFDFPLPNELKGVIFFAQVMYYSHEN